MGLAAVAALFSFGITDGHIGLDDWGYTSGCPFVRGGLNWDNVTRAFCDFGYGAIWMPITFVSYMLDMTVFGDSWKAYHAVNVCLHIANTIFVYRFLLSVLKCVKGTADASLATACAAAAIVWAVHPMRAESVTFVASRKEELWTLFSLSGALAFNAFLSRNSIGGYVLTVALFLLALMSKPTAMCLPFVLSLIAYIEQRLDKRTVVSLLPLFALSVFAGLLTVYSQSHPSNAVSVDVYDATFSWRVLNAIVSVGLYVWYTIWPFGIHMDYLAVFNGWPTDGTLGIAVAISAGMAMFVTYIRVSAQGRRVLLGAILIAAVSLGPTLGVFGYVNGDQAMADRYAYFPHVAIALSLAYMLSWLAADRHRRKVTSAILVLYVLFEIVVAIPVVKSYENGYTACSRALQKDPDNWRALRIVGNEYCARHNRVSEGIAMLRKSFQLRKSQLTADSLAYVLAIHGAESDFQEVKRLGAAAARNPKGDEGGMMLDALGIVHMRESDYLRAAHFFRESLKVAKRNHSPDWSLLYLGLNLANIGKRNEAVRVLSRLQNSRFAQVANRAKSALQTLSSDTGSIEFGWE